MEKSIEEILNKNETTKLQEVIEHTEELCPTEGEKGAPEHNIKDLAMEQNIKSSSPSELYFESLALWAADAASASLMSNYLQMFHNTYYYWHLAMAMQRSPLLFTYTTVKRRSYLNHLAVQDSIDIICRNGGKKFLIVAFWKRALAEVLDSLFLLIFKLFIGFMVYSNFNSNKSLNQDGHLLIFLFRIMGMFSVSFDLIVGYFLSQLFACWYECFWTTFAGVTPGKYIMKLRVVHVKAMVILQPAAVYQFVFYPHTQPIWAYVYPAQRLNWVRCFERAFVKNMLLPTVFPLCVAMLFLKDNQTSYDLLIKTVVVDVQARRD